MNKHYIEQTKENQIKMKNCMIETTHLGPFSRGKWTEDGANVHNNKLKSLKIK